MLIQPIGLLGNQVAQSMTHPDARELSSLIINTLGSYELKKGCGGYESDMSTPFKSSLSLCHPASFLCFVIFPVVPPCDRTKVSFGYLKKKTQIGWKSVFSVQHFTAVTWLLCRVLFLEAPGVLQGLSMHHQKWEK